MRLLRCGGLTASHVTEKCIARQSQSKHASRSQNTGWVTSLAASDKTSDSEQAARDTIAFPPDVGPDFDHCRG